MINKDFIATDEWCIHCYAKPTIELTSKYSHIYVCDNCFELHRQAFEEAFLENETDKKFTFKTTIEKKILELINLIQEYPHEYNYNFNLINNNYNININIQKVKK